MNTSKKTQFILGAFNLATFADAAVMQEPVTLDLNQKSEPTLQASLRSIEETWMKVPQLCKAQNFNASPVPLNSTELTAAAQAIYLSYEV